MSFSPTLLLNVTGFSVRFLGLHRVLSVLLVFFYRVFPRFERVTIFRRGGGSLTVFFVVLPDWMPWFTEFFLPGFRLVGLFMSAVVPFRRAKQQQKGRLERLEKLFTASTFTEFFFLPGFCVRVC